MTVTGTETLVEVDTIAGRVRGRWRADAAGNASAAFLGIPFGEPPVGERRFAAPVPHGPWEGVLDATAYAPTAQRGDPGVTLIPEPSVPGDSTLNVNVFTPTPSTDAALPVLVYIHGGGYFAGSPASPWYDGAAFNRDGVVTVSISYRLGFDGFGWIADAPMNRGVLDWLLALEWVRDNIAAFGGDPARVTIAGQSAGGGAVLTLLGMPSAQPLIAGVYSISGAAADVTLAEAESFGRRLAAASAASSRPAPGSPRCPRRGCSSCRSSSPTRSRRRPHGPAAWLHRERAHARPRDRRRASSRTPPSTRSPRASVPTSRSCSVPPTTSSR